MLNKSELENGGEYNKKQKVPRENGGQNFFAFDGVWIKPFGKTTSTHTYCFSYEKVWSG